MLAIERYSRKLGYRALLITSLISLLGAGLGMVGVIMGTVVGLERPLVLSCLIYSILSLAYLLYRPGVPVQTIATISTIYFGVYLTAGVFISVFGRGEHLSVFVYLIWFYPLLAYHRVVTEPVAGAMIARVLQVLPLLLVAGLSWRMVTLFPMGLVTVLITYCIGYAGFGLMINAVTRYREAYIVERERGRALHVESKVLESISDCFLSLDSGSRLIYLNDAGCLELGLDRRKAIGQDIFKIAPDFFSELMRSGFASAAVSPVATLFEAQDETLSQWYVLRCFPRVDGMSVYFLNITERLQSRMRLEEAQARNERLARYDTLTELPNRLLLQELLEKAVSTGRRGALLLVDVDDFKTINDTQGHELGDLLLKKVAHRLSTCTQPGGTLARLGGDEFVLMLEGLSDDADAGRREANAVAKTILGAFETPLRCGSYESDSTVSVGIAFFRNASDSVDETLKRAELAMYAAKAQGRSSVCHFSPPMAVEVAARAALQADLRRALLNREFELYYQPLVNTEGRVVGAEALLRWIHPLRGFVPPNEFIPLAEKDGLIIELGRWVLSTACRQLALWKVHDNLGTMTVAVNVSMLQFRDSNFEHLVQEVLAETKADPQLLKLEITESSFMEKVEDTIKKIDALRSLGVGFSLDDFGTGYSSLSHLKRLALDQLKIDRSFVKDILTDQKTVSIVSTIITLGNNLNLTVIAEGVETEAQREFLEREGCDVYQGYLFSPAVPIREFEEFVIAAKRYEASGVSLCATRVSSWDRRQAGRLT